MSLAFITVASAAEPKAVLPVKHKVFLDKYCMDCHDTDTEKGKVNLEDLPFQIETLEHAERWQHVLASLNAGEMPPEKKKQPTIISSRNQKLRLPHRRVQRWDDSRRDVSFRSPGAHTRNAFERFMCHSRNPLLVRPLYKPLHVHDHA